MGVVQSHITVPKSILKNFNDQNGLLSYYDVIGMRICNKGHAKTLGTSKGYYPEQIEQLLNRSIETPISEVINSLRKANAESSCPVYHLKKRWNAIILSYLSVLLTRNPTIKDHLCETIPFFQVLPEEMQSGACAIYGYILFKEKGFLTEHSITFAMNRTSIPFVLPTCGIFQHGDRKFHPIDPFFSIVLLPQSISVETVQNNQLTLNLLPIENSDDINDINRSAFTAQVSLGWGHVVSNRIDILNDLILSMQN